jgi:hypothetical protein
MALAHANLRDWRGVALEEERGRQAGADSVVSATVKV